MKEKPITLKVEELKENIAATLNESGLPIFLLDYIIKDLYNEIHILSENQLLKDKQSYAKSQEESEQEESEKQ